MVRSGCEKAILLGGHAYLVFHRESTRSYGQDHLFVSSSYPVFAVPPMPSLISVLIALLLSDDSDMAYKPPITIDRVRDLRIIETSPTA